MLGIAKTCGTLSLEVESRACRTDCACAILASVWEKAGRSETGLASVTCVLEAGRLALMSPKRANRTMDSAVGMLLVV